MRSPLVSEIISAGLVTSGQPWLGVEFHPAIGSTNTRLRELLTGSAPDAAATSRATGEDPAGLWWVVLTDHQTGGRGRLGRTWEVPERASIAVSAAVPVSGPERAGWLPLVAGLALTRALRDVSREAGHELTPRLKWPNDVLLADDGDRKVSGILCELVTLPTTPARYAVVVGTGVNVDQSRDELPVDTATSIGLAGVRVRRETLVVRYLRELATLVRTVPPDEAAAAYRLECATIGQQVRIQLPAGASMEGQAVTVDDDGALVVATSEGTRSFAAGDVVHVRRP